MAPKSPLPALDHTQGHVPQQTRPTFQGSDTLAALEPHTQPGEETGTRQRWQQLCHGSLAHRTKSPALLSSHTSAHQPLTPATLLVTLHIPPTIPPACSHPGSCRHLSCSSHTFWVTTPFQTLPHTCPDSFPTAPCLALSRLPSPLASQSRTLSLQQKPDTCDSTDFQRQGSSPTCLFLSLGLGFFWKRRAGRGLQKRPRWAGVEMEPHMVVQRDISGDSATPHVSPGTWLLAKLGLLTSGSACTHSVITS